MIERIKWSFKRLSDQKLIEFTRALIVSFLNNDYFPEGSEKVKSVEDALDVFSESIPSPKQRNVDNTRVKNDYKSQLIYEISRLALYAEYKADFNVKALQSVNFELHNKKQPKGLVGVVDKIILKTTGNAGEIIAQCASDPNASYYHARVSLDEQNWQFTGTNSNRNVKVASIPPGERLYVQMRLENTLGLGPWSNSTIGMIGMPEVIANIHGR